VVLVDPSVGGKISINALLSVSLVVCIGKLMADTLKWVLPIGYGYAEQAYTPVLWAEFMED